MAEAFRSLSLKTRVLLVVLALFIAGIWGLAARVAAVLQADLEKLLAEQMSATVDYVAADIDSKDWLLRRFDPSGGQAAGALGLIGAGLLGTLAIGRLGADPNEGDESA